MRWLTENGEREQKVLEHLGAEFGTFGLRPGLNGLQVTLVHPHLNLFRHTVGTATERQKNKQNTPLQNAKLSSWAPSKTHTWWPHSIINLYVYHVATLCHVWSLWERTRHKMIKCIIQKWDPLDVQWKMLNIQVCCQAVTPTLFMVTIASNRWKRTPSCCL